MGNDAIFRFAWTDLGHLDADALRRTADFSGAFTTTPSASAAHVPDLLAPRHDMILLRDDDGPVIGIITKDWLKQFTNRSGADLSELLREAAKQEDPVFPLYEAPALRWCDEGKHYTTACPCRDHLSSPCG